MRFGAASCCKDSDSLLFNNPVSRNVARGFVLTLYADSVSCNALDCCGPNYVEALREYARLLDLTEILVSRDIRNLTDCTSLREQGKNNPEQALWLNGFQCEGLSLMVVYTSSIPKPDTYRTRPGRNQQKWQAHQKA